MIRTTVLLLLLGSLLAPSRTMGQVADTVEVSPESRVFLETLQTILDYHATSFSDSALWEGAIEGLLEGLDDPYAHVFTPDEVADFTETNTGDYAGIGVQITELNDRVTITAVYRGTPAYEVGLMVGDQIVEVNGESAVDWSNRKASEVIRGEPGTMVEISVARERIPEPIPHQIRRAQVHIPAV
ncbi:MAG: PDZ domain-containing protein, partial [Gemmatimonadetes bacterium]|nr:PDZ domain-containing protein [Gemmatimonadota bacterium]